MDRSGLLSQLLGAFSAAGDEEELYRPLVNVTGRAPTKVRIFRAAIRLFLLDSQQSIELFTLIRQCVGLLSAIASISVLWLLNFCSPHVAKPYKIASILLQVSETETGKYK